MIEQPKVPAVAAVLWALALSVGPAQSAEPVQPELSAIVGATSDYVYRGVSLRGEDPSPILSLDAAYGALYANVYLVGTTLGSDALGRDLGFIEADFTAGWAPTVGPVKFNMGARYTHYPVGRDIIAGTLIPAERDFIEPFAGATLDLGHGATLGATGYWTPDYYYETGTVTTLEGTFGLVLPTLGPLQSKASFTAGAVESENPNVVSPGSGYSYYNVGIEGAVDHFVFDVRYWSTDVEGFDVFDERIALSAGIRFP